MYRVFGGYLRHDTAVTIQLGPFVDQTDGFTPETGLTIAQADVQVSKNGGAFAQKTATDTAVHQAMGVYSCQLYPAEVDTHGKLLIVVDKSSTARIFCIEYAVIDESEYDLMFTDGTTVVRNLYQVNLTGRALNAGSIVDDARLKDRLFERSVVSRHANGKPLRTTVGAELDAFQVDTTQDGSGNIQTQSLV